MPDLRSTRGLVLALVLVGCLSETARICAQEAISAGNTGAYFEVSCEGGDERLAALALKVVDPVWPLVCEAFGVTDAKPKKPLKVVLYRDLDGYLKADLRLTGGQFQPNQAMAHWGSQTAHVAMQPACDDEYLARYGLPMQTQAMLAWEACHIVRFELCRNFRSHPGWFQDGLASATAKEVLRGLHPTLGKQPFFTQRWSRVVRLVADGDLPAVSALLADQTEGLTMRDRYAARIAFFEFVRQSHPDKAILLAGMVRSTAGGDDYSAKVQKSAARLVGALGSDFEEKVRGIMPEWDESVRSMWCFGDEWHQMAFTGMPAQSFHTESVRGGAFHATGTVLIHDGGSRQMNFLFARASGTMYSLAFTAGAGFKVMEHRGYGDHGRVVGRMDDVQCETGVDVRFDIRGRGKKLNVSINGKAWQLDLPHKLPADIVWGVGAQASSGGNGSFGIWRKVKVTGG